MARVSLPSGDEAVLLTRHEDVRRMLSDPRFGPVPAAEETLRFDADPGVGIPRYLTEATEAGGTVLPAGTTVVCSMGAANRDATVLDVLLRRLPSLELAVAAEELRRLEGLAVGGLREVPVRW